MTKRAYIDIVPEFAPQFIGILHDAGLRIVGSDACPHPEAIRLFIEGDLLPNECALGTIQVVRATVTTEPYGSQRIHRLTEIVVTDDPA